MSNNAYYMDSTTRVYHNFLKTYGSKADQSMATAFRNMVAEKIAAGESLQGMEISTKDMTMDEYKKYIYDKISNLPVHPSNSQDSVAVHISDAGFEAMKNDPEYEEWVLNTLKRDFAASDPWSSYCGGKYSIFYFGGTKDEYRGESWRMGYQNGRGESIFNRKAEESYWERLAKRRKRRKEQYEEYEKKKAIEKRRAQHEYFVKAAEIAAENRRLAEMGEAEKQIPEIPAVYETNMLMQLISEKLFKGES